MVAGGGYYFVWRSWFRKSCKYEFSLKGVPGLCCCNSWLCWRTSRKSYSTGVHLLPSSASCSIYLWDWTAHSELLLLAGLRGNSMFKPWEMSLGTSRTEWKGALLWGYCCSYDRQEPVVSEDCHMLELQIFSLPGLKIKKH